MYEYKSRKQRVNLSRQRVSRPNKQLIQRPSLLGDGAHVLRCERQP